MKKKLKYDKKYLIDWVDSVAMGGIWCSYKDLHDLCDTGHCQTIGWFNSEQNGMLAFHSQKSRTGQCGGTMAIPRVAILKAKRIK